MSQEQQDAAIGKVVRERNKAEKHLGVLRAEASRLAGIFDQLADFLAHNPQQIVFELDSNDVKYAQAPRFNKSDLSAEDIIKLTDEIRDTMRTLSDLQQQAHRLGI